MPPFHNNIWQNAKRKVVMMMMRRVIQCIYKKKQKKKTAFLKSRVSIIMSGGEKVNNV